MLEVKNVCISYELKTAVKNLSFQLKEGQWLMIVGPNGAGKSTIIEAPTKGVNYQGNIILKNKEISTYNNKDLAKEIGTLSQTHRINYDFSIQDVVKLGLYSKKENYSESIINQALIQTGLFEMKDKTINTISGGELQRVFLAQVFAQDPNILLLDEPLNHLDLQYQKQFLSLIQKWLHQPHKAVISVIHDLSIAKKFGTHAILLSRGETITQGLTNEVFNNKSLNQAYNTNVTNWYRNILEQW